MRPCLVNGVPATFHLWEQRSFFAVPTVYGGTGGQVSKVRAIVEHENGTISLEHPLNIQFTDKEVKDDGQLSFL